MVSVTNSYLDGEKKQHFQMPGRKNIVGAKYKEGCGKRLAGGGSRSQIIKGLNSILRNLDFLFPLRTMVNH